MITLAGNPGATRRGSLGTSARVSSMVRLREVIACFQKQFYDVCLLPASLRTSSHRQRHSIFSREVNCRLAGLQLRFPETGTQLLRAVLSMTVCPEAHGFIRAWVVCGPCK